MESLGCRPNLLGDFIPKPFFASRIQIVFI